MSTSTQWKLIFVLLLIILLCCTAQEYTDLVNHPDHQDVLKTWRGRLVQQFVSEQRGPLWVQDGKLMQRIKGQLYSPNYPKTSTLSV